jgi:hypothetical protein
VTDSIFPTGEVARFRRRVMAALRRCHWPSLVSGAAVSFAALHLGTTQPLLTQVDKLERRISIVDSRLYQLTGAARDAEHANNLLGTLIAQGEQVAAAREALDSISDLRLSLAAGAQQTEDAHQIVGRWHDLAGSLIASHDLQPRTARAIEEIDALQQDVIALGTAVADSQTGIAASRAFVTEVTSLQAQLAATAGGTTAARNALEGIDALQQRIVAGGERTGEAQQSAESLIALKDSLAATAQIDTATGNAERLIGLQQTLSSDSRLQLDAATQNAEKMVGMQASIAGQTQQIAAGVENLDLMVDFHDELNNQLSQVEKLRHQMVELMLLETTLSRTMTALAPLTELNDLRKMNDEDMRGFARTMLDRRRERVASAESKYDEPKPTTAEAVAADRLVPEPPAE